MPWKHQQQQQDPAGQLSLRVHSTLQCSIEFSKYLTLYCVRAVTLTQLSRSENVLVSMAAAAAVWGSCQAGYA
jgi:hypothetical protein